MQGRIKGNIVDIFNKEIYPGELVFAEGKITEVKRLEAETVLERYIMPGFVDAHVHVESSMLVPSEFARMAVCHGTVATVSDPHEIANVLGVDGVDFMVENGKQVPFKFFFGAPSCVPATVHETAGAVIDVEGVRELLGREDIHYLAEMMNWPGVLARDGEVMAKIKAAHDAGKPVDGHAPQLRGEQAKAYAEAGITTDHECVSEAEARDKLIHGVKVQIREGSAAKNYEALKPLISEHADRMMFCMDDTHPNHLIDGHINTLVRRALADGFDLFDVLRMVTLNPVEHYKLDVGLLREGDEADFIVTDGTGVDFEVLGTYISGERVAEEGRTLIGPVEVEPVNRFVSREILPDAFGLEAKTDKMRVVTVEDGQIVTGQEIMSVKEKDGMAVADPETDVLKLAVISRYDDKPPAVAFIRGFGFGAGAVASTVAHDSHNIIAVGADDESMAKAVNVLMESKGGLSVVGDAGTDVLPLPVAGLMSAQDGFELAGEYDEIVRKAGELGTRLHDPFMTLSFMALLVIPELKLSDQGLFDGRKFEFVDLFV
ncbi:adenine deaminase [Fulvitalea axinellae]|uniref:Adenine deaminase n=1 Tax=Fulvitalea axinellae TaxID=1182444 RepID=A0AAU9DBK3_9BACT|nr:adenine deaminase [Fulvitalea axinellae]